MYSGEALLGPIIHFAIGKDTRVPCLLYNRNGRDLTQWRHCWLYWDSSQPVFNQVGGTSPVLGERELWGIVGSDYGALSTWFTGESDVAVKIRAYNATRYIALGQGNVPRGTDSSSFVMWKDYLRAMLWSVTCGTSALPVQEGLRYEGETPTTNQSMTLCWWMSLRGVVWQGRTSVKCSTSVKMKDHTISHSSSVSAQQVSIYIKHADCKAYLPCMLLYYLALQIALLPSSSPPPPSSLSMPSSLMHNR